MADLHNPSKTGGKLIATNKVNGTSFYNGAGQKLLRVGEGVDGFLESLDADMDARWSVVPQERCPSRTPAKKARVASAPFASVSSG